MKKSAILDVDRDAVLRYALGGLLAGSGAAAVLRVIRMAREAQEARKAKAEQGRTGKDTIVVSLPSKAASGDVTGADQTYGTTVTGTGSSIIPKPESPKQVELRRQHRTPQGMFGSSLGGDTMTTSPAQGKIGSPYSQKAGIPVTMAKTGANWPTITAAVLSALGSGAVGATVVDALMQKYREKQLKDELNAVRQQYIDTLSQPRKMAEAWTKTFGDCGIKVADTDILGLANVPLATAAIFGLLGSAGAAYLTKKILDQKLNEAEAKGLDLPRIRQIIFKTNDGKPVADAANVKTSAADVVTALIGISTDDITGTDAICGCDNVKAAIKEAQINPEQFARGTRDVDTLYAVLRANPKVTEAIIRAYMSTHPMARHFRWSLAIPAVRRMAERKLFKTLDTVFDPSQSVMNFLPANALTDARHLPNMKMPGLTAKLAAFVPVTTPALLAGIIGNKLVADPKEDIATAVVEAQKKLDEDKRQAKVDAPEAVSKRIKLEASDAKAEAYLEQHRERILALLKQLAERGQI